MCQIYFIFFSWSPLKGSAWCGRNERSADDGKKEINGRKKERILLHNAEMKCSWSAGVISSIDSIFSCLFICPWVNFLNLNGYWIKRKSSGHYSGSRERWRALTLAFYIPWSPGVQYFCLRSRLVFSHPSGISHNRNIFSRCVIAVRYIININWMPVARVEARDYISRQTSVDIIISYIRFAASVRLFFHSLRDNAYDFCTEKNIVVGQSS